MRILITGGTGFIGVPLVRRLLSSGHEILIYDAFPNVGALGEKEISKVQVIHGDVTRWDELYDACKDFMPEAIIHLAARISKQAEEHPLQALEVNMNGTVNTFEVAQKLGIAKILFPSTVAAFSSDVPAPISIGESQQPKSVYGITKVFCELWGNYCADRYGIDFRSVRLPSIIGPGRVDGGASVYASLMIERPAKGLPYEVHAAKDSNIPILYTEDAVNAILTLFEARTVRRRIYNASGIVPTALEIAEEVRKHVKDAKISFNPLPDVVRLLTQWKQMDSSEFEKDTGWHASFPLEKMVAQFISTVKANQRN